MEESFDMELLSNLLDLGVYGIYQKLMSRTS
jgi:hypothetical protein